VADPKITRLAMWSGPRNLSSAMMRAWENRADTCVVDEPFYAAFLSSSSVRHPMQEQVIASQPTSTLEVIRKNLQNDLSGGHTIQFQKHMTQHIIGEVDEVWFKSIKHAFLIRHPAEVVASYSAKRESVTSMDIGFFQQKKLYDLAIGHGFKPPIVDAADILKRPKDCLKALCENLGLRFHENMLHWPAGTRDSDGVWAQHWYQSVQHSTGFAPYRKKLVTLSPIEQKVVDECMPIYTELHKQRIIPA
jgi:hypothetical protein